MKCRSIEEVILKLQSLTLIILWSFVATVGWETRVCWIACFTCSRANVLLNCMLYVLTCQRALCCCELTCQCVLLAYMLTCQRAWRAKCPRATTSNMKISFQWHVLLGTFSFLFCWEIKIYMKSIYHKQECLWKDFENSIVYSSTSPTRRKFLTSAMTNFVQ